jgi:hypothetical protein
MGCRGQGDVDVATWTARLAEPFQDRLVIVGFDPLAGMTRLVPELRSWGARRPLLIALGVGTGPVPSAEDADVLVLDAPAATMMTEGVRATAALAEEPPAEVIDAVRRYDPAGEAVWCVGPFIRSGSLLGRPVFGGRPAEWAALEDKTAVDQLWEALDAPHAAFSVVPPSHRALRAAAGELDAGSGTVWSGDARGGINGGGDFVRWVRTHGQASAAADFFAERCERVRVMPFLDGVPCSIHGVVLPDGVAVLRPVELVVLRRPDTGRFVYGGISTWWDPPDADREDMRALARRTGELLARRVGYRGGFSIDGVLTADGFRATELNPRFSGGLARMARPVPELPVELLQLNLVAGRPPGIDAATLERLLVAAVDSHRSGDAMGVSTAVRLIETQTVEVVATGDRFQEAAGAEPFGTVLAGPNAAGAFVRFLPAPGRLARGERMARYAIAMMAFADARWGTRFGPVEAAPDVRVP